MSEINEEKEERYEKALYEVRGCVKSMLCNEFYPRNSLDYYNAIKEIGNVANHALNYGATPPKKPIPFRRVKKQ